jgi:hypothetical protein
MNLRDDERINNSLVYAMVYRTLAFKRDLSEANIVNSLFVKELLDRLSHHTRELCRCACRLANYTVLSG